MIASFRPARRGRPAARLSLEALESRHLLTGPALGTADPTEPNDVLGSAVPLTLDESQAASAAGTIGGEAGPADVDWYRVELGAPARLGLRVAPTGGGEEGVTAVV